MAKGYAAYIADEHRKLEKELLNDAYSKYSKINRKVEVDIEDEMLFDDRETQGEKQQISSKDEIFKDERQINSYHSSKRGLFDFFEKVQTFGHEDEDKECIINNPACDISSEESQKKESSIEDNTVTGLMMRIQRLGSAAFVNTEESAFTTKSSKSK